MKNKFSLSFASSASQKDIKLMNLNLSGITKTLDLDEIIKKIFNYQDLKREEQKQRINLITTRLT